MYHVDLSGETHKRIKALYLKATRENRAEAYIAAFKEIVRRLEHDPDEFGEPLYRLPVLNILIRKAIIIPLAVEYSVSDNHHLVIIKGIKLMDVH